MHRYRCIYLVKPYEIAIFGGFLCTKKEFSTNLGLGGSIQKYRAKFVHLCLIYNSRKVEATQASI